MHRFWFNEAVDTWDTVTSQSEYTLGTGGVASDVLHITDMVIDWNGRPLVLEPVDPVFIHHDSVIDTPTVPRFYSFDHSKILLWPPPNSVYTVSMWYTQDFNTFTEASADASTNAWFTYAERLIRNHAKALLFGEILRNDAEESRAIAVATRALLDLKMRSSSLKTGWQPTPWGL
jgi:hypothetical protein